jgi:hypothetical protein
MDIQTSKLQVMKLILEIENPEILESIRKLLTKNVRKDFWNSLSKEEKHDIESGISEIENGDTVGYESIVGKHRK